MRDHNAINLPSYLEACHAHSTLDHSRHHHGTSGQPSVSMPDLANPASAHTPFQTARRPAPATHKGPAVPSQAPLEPTIQPTGAAATSPAPDSSSANEELTKEDELGMRRFLRFVSIYGILCLIWLVITVHHIHSHQKLHYVAIGMQVLLIILAAVGSTERLTWVGMIYFVLSPAGPALCLAAVSTMPAHYDQYWAAETLFIFSMIGVSFAGFVVFMGLVGLVHASVS